MLLGFILSKVLALEGKKSESARTFGKALEEEGELGRKKFWHLMVKSLQVPELEKILINQIKSAPLDNGIQDLPNIHKSR